MHQAELAEIDFLRDVAERLRAAAHGAAGPIVEEACRFLDVTPRTLYTRLRGIGWTSGRKLRSDKGDTRVTEDEVRAVAAIMTASRRMTGKLLLPVGDAIEIARANNLLRTRIEPETMLRVMRRLGCHPTQAQRPSPHTSMRSLHPNHVWQLDASICVLYYLRNGRAQVMDERKFNARKPTELARTLPLRLLRYAITDHTTGDVIARYYLAAGEDQRTLFDFLMWAFHAQEGRVMHGVPWMLVWDAGSANQSHGIVNLLTALGVRHWAHIPGNSRAKGQVERTHNLVETKFEGRLSFTRVESVEQLNDHLFTWLRALNGSDVHSRHGHTRDALWQTIRADQLRLCPPVDTCAALMHSKPEPRVVSGNLTVTFKPRGAEQRYTYSVADVPEVRSGEPVLVAVNPYRTPCIYVIARDLDGSLRYFECEPLERDAAGFLLQGSAVFGESYAARPDSDVDRARKDANEAAYGERDTGDALAAKAKGRVAFDGRIDPFKDVAAKAAATPAFMQRRGTALDVPNPVHVELRPLDLISALKEIRIRIERPVTPDEATALREQFPEGIPETELDAIADRLRNPQPAPARPRLVAVP